MIKQEMTQQEKLQSIIDSAVTDGFNVYPAYENGCLTSVNITVAQMALFTIGRGGGVRPDEDK